MLLNFADRTRSGVFNVIWPLARACGRVRAQELRVVGHRGDLAWQNSKKLNQNVTFLRKIEFCDWRLGGQ